MAINVRKASILKNLNLGKLLENGYLFKKNPSEYIEFFGSLFAIGKDTAFDGKVNTSKTKELVSMLNGQIGRTAFTTFPRMINGTNMGTLLFQELGLYNTPELKDLKGKILKPLQQLPGSAGKAFTPDEKPKEFTEEQILEMLDAFS